ncbi:MAG: multi-sensor signal transduction histidine kinase [Candidatus Acidoferrum typicum]|nr:multi-sensor signal transduction histidine kinase [Candidatus Acidoferrum typicum]
MLGKLAGWATKVSESTFHLHRFNIGPRLTLGFLFIVLALLMGNAVSLWQFHLARTQADRLNGVDQELITVLQAHTSLMSFYERLDAFTHSENTGQLVREVEALRNAILQESRRSRDALSRLPAGVQLDPALLPTLLSIEDTLPAELEAITALAQSNEWDAVRLRLANQVRPLESRSSELVENIDREVGEQRAQAVLNIEQAQRRILLILSVTAALTLLFAAFLGSAITRSITQPLGRLMEGSTAWARGDFSHRVPGAGKDEIARLGSVFNDMIVRLQELYRELQRREAYLTEAQRLSHTGSWAWNLLTQRVFWSAETFQIFGVDPNTTTPTMESFLESVHPDDRTTIALVDTEVRHGNDAKYDFRIVLPDHSIKYITSVAHPIRNDSGQVIEFVGTVMDVTERKRAEEERERLRQVQADLAHLSRITTMGELTASLAHEIRQPITAALTNAKTSLRWLDRDTPELEEARAATSRMIRDVTRAADIISRISLLFKKGGSQGELVDVNELIREMIVLLRSEANRYSISIRTELAQHLPNARADRVQLQQVFMNLMLNGIDAMKGTTNGGELTIKSEACDAQLLISVSDTGVGFPPEQADQIFSAFFTTKDSGTGMGLPISRSIIESHGGRLWAVGASGRGATFQFTLPATVAAHA